MARSVTSTETRWSVRCAKIYGPPFAEGAEVECGFGDRGQVNLVYAANDVQADDDAVGLVKIGASIQRRTASGRFNALVQGPTLAGLRGTVFIRISDGPTTSGELPPRWAAVPLTRLGEAGVCINGTWICALEIAMLAVSPERPAFAQGHV